MSRKEETTKKLQPSEKKEQDNLKCILTEEELCTMGQRQAQLIYDKTVVEADLKSYQTEAKNKIAVIDAEVNKTSENIRNGYVFRFVEVIKTTDYEAGIVTHKRLDTDEIYYQRPLREDEKQLALETKVDAGMEEAPF